MRCAYCDELLTEKELRLTDPRTNQQRGCNVCWASIQESLSEFEKEDQLLESEEFPVIDELEVVSLEEVKYDTSDDDNRQFDD